MPFVALNIPPADLQIRTKGAGHEVFDPLRERWVELTPEEWGEAAFCIVANHLQGISAFVNG